MSELCLIGRHYAPRKLNLYAIKIPNSNKEAFKATLCNNDHMAAYTSNVVTEVRSG